ncbi:MAG: ABC transporter ATP-binding protein [Proteobacteria bacterium]|nr:ABC transporter ATP-binding protein [Pseudomonadota bacterium]
MKDKLLKNPLIYLACMMWRSGAGRRPQIVLHLTLSVISMGFWLSTPLIIARFMNAAQAAAYAGQLAECAWLLAAMVTMGVIGWCFHGPSRVIELVSAFCIRRNLQSELLTKVSQLPLSWHKAHHSGETIDRITRASAALGSFAEGSFEALGLITRYVGAIIMLSLFMPVAGFYIGIATCVILVAILLFDRWLIPLYDESNSKISKVAAAVQDYLTNITTVISLRLEDRVVREVNAKMDRIRPLALRTSVMQESKWFSASLLIDLMRAVVLLCYIISVFKTKAIIEIGTLYALNEYLSTIGQAFFSFTSHYGNYVQSAAKLRAVEYIHTDHLREVGPTALLKLPNDWRSIELNNVCFQHQGEGRITAGLFGVDLKLTQGRSYAIVGESGSGKSTLLAILRGLQQPSNGTVICDGELQPEGLAAITHHTTLIPQEPEAVYRALSMAQFSNVLERLPRGLETNIAEKGVSLSGGEKQRLALARGIFFAADRDSEIVLLDESTSSVDIVNERRIYETILKHFGARIIISAVHKFNLLDLFDEIIVMEQGRITESGSLMELLRKKGEFSRLWERYANSAKSIEAVG